MESLREQQFKLLKKIGKQRLMDEIDQMTKTSDSARGADEIDVTDRSELLSMIEGLEEQILRETD